AHPVALDVEPGDKVRTSTVDASGIDASGERVSEGGNPLTGPFRVVGAEPGDAVTVRIVELAPNRDSGWASHRLAPVTLEPEHVLSLAAGERRRYDWTIDRGAGRVAPTEQVPGLQG